MSDERTRRPVDEVPDGAGPDAAAVAAAFDLGTPLGPPQFAARGELGRIWRLDTDRGTWAVKQLLTAPEPADVAVDVALQHRAIAAGVSAPRPVLAADGSVVVVVDASSIRMHTWADLLPGPVSADAVATAAQLGRMHSAAVTDPSPVDPWFCDPVAPASFADLATAARSDQEPWAVLMAQRLDDLAAANEVIGQLDRSRTSHVCHCDVNPQNVLVGVDGGAVVVDWENAGSFWLHCELASTIAEFEVQDTEMPDFLRAYADHGGTAEIDDRSSFAGILAVQGNLVEHYAQRALDPTAPDEERGRARFWLDDMLRHLLTVERVDAWTASCHAARQ